MCLLRLTDVETSPRDRVFYYSRIRALIFAFVALGASGALLLRAVSAHWNAGYYLAAVILLFVLLLNRFVTARFRPSNWLVRMNDTGLFIQFRSYLNYHLPAEDLTVVFLSYDELGSARLVRERARVSDSQGRTATQVRRYIELELVGDIQPLAKALQAELVEKAPSEKRWYGSSSTLYEDHPVRMSSPPFLRLRWQVVPRARMFLEALRPYTTIADTVSTAENFVHLQALSREEQKKRLRELKERGESIAAIYMARKIYGCGLEQARSIIENLHEISGNK
jgi:hypothetical protein